MIANTSYESPLNFKNISKNTSNNKSNITCKTTINKNEEQKINEEFKPTPMITRSKVRNRFLSNDNQPGIINKLDIYNKNNIDNNIDKNNLDKNINKNNLDKNNIYKNNELDMNDIE